MLPLIGRHGELRELERSRAAGDVGLVLAGPAGVGKSSLARAALTEAEAAGAATLWIQATRSAAAIPLGAFAGVLPPEVGSDDPLALLAAGAGALRELAGQRRLVLGVDDAQLLDDTSAALVLHAARAEAAFVVVTVRTGEPCPDAIVALWKDAGAERVELAALGEPETGELVEAIAGGPVEEGVRQWAWRLSAGNALYVGELLHGALADGALRPAGGLWCRSGRLRVGASLAELIVERLAGLEPAERRVLELLALGEPLRLSQLAAQEGLDALVAVEAQGLIRLGDASPDPALRLAHPLYGEAISAGLGTLRAREIRLKLATLVPGDALRVARWLMEAGETIPAALLPEAARAAILSGDPEFGAILAARAAEAGGNAEAQLLLARAYAARNRFDEAAAVLADAEDRLASRQEALAFIEQQTAVLYWGVNRTGELGALLDRAAGWWPDEVWRHRIDSLRAYVSREDPGAGDAGTRREQSTAHLRSLFYGGRGRDAYRLALSLRPQVPLRDLYDEVAVALWVGIGAETGEGWPELERWCGETLRAGVRRDDHSAAGVAALGLGVLRFCDGRYREAARWLAEAQVHYEHHDPLGSLVIVAAYQAGVARAVGDDAGGDAALARCRGALRGDPPPPNQLPYAICAEGWAAGDRAILLAGVASVAPLYAARLTYEALRMGEPVEIVAPALTALDAQCDASLVAAQAAHAVALLAGDGEALFAAAERLAAIGALRYACEAAAAAARAFAAAGHEEPARRAAAESRRLFAADQGGRRPDTGVTTELSAREQQLMELAAGGLSNAEIADRLVLSVRTVESHIYRAMQKLGLSDRRELARYVQ
jgi:DNA-binding NarL/FixJ family response regulator